MLPQNASRRTFLGSAASFLTAAALGRPGPAPGRASTPLSQGRALSCNVYTWMTFFAREGRDWFENLDASLAEYARSGLTVFEPSVGEATELETLGPLLREHGLRMDSVYVGSSLHDDAEAEESIAQILQIADAARALGARVIVTNPNPLPEQQCKSDEQLRTQARNLDRLGAALRERSVALAYHNHDPELRCAAREFHHMMLATDPEHVGLCLEPHWIYRGSGNSQVALFDIMRLYGRRTVEVHLRQSRGGVWTETFGPGDIDYVRFAQELERLAVQPLLVLEQAVEPGTPHTMDAVEAHKRSSDYALEVFGLAGA